MEAYSLFLKEVLERIEELWHRGLGDVGYCDSIQGVEALSRYTYILHHSP